MKKNLLIVSTGLPWPLNRGGNTGVFYTLEYVSRFMNITFVTLYDIRKKNDKYLPALKEKLPNVEFILYYYNKSPLLKCNLGWKAISFIANRLNFPNAEKKSVKLLDVIPLSTIFPGYIKFVNDLIVSKNIDIVQMEFFQTHNMVYAMPSNVKKVFIHHELGWVVRDQKYGNDMYSSFMKKYLLAEEVSALNQYDLVVAMTSIDKEKLHKVGVTTRVEYSSLPVTDKICPKQKHKYDGRLTFVGFSGHTPNYDGVRWFVKEVLPKVLEKHPETKLEVIGNWSRDAIKDVSSLSPNVVFKGFVEDLGEAIKNSIMVVPINIGSGMRMKILESANYSVPFVSTVVGAEGLTFQSGRDCFICETPEAMADSIVSLIEDDSLYQKLSSNVHDYFVDNYSLESLGKKRISVYENL